MRKLKIIIVALLIVSCVFSHVSASEFLTGKKVRGYSYICDSKAKIVMVDNKVRCKAMLTGVKGITGIDSTFCLQRKTKGRWEDVKYYNKDVYERRYFSASRSFAVGKGVYRLKVTFRVFNDIKYQTFSICSTSVRVR